MSHFYADDCQVYFAVKNRDEQTDVEKLELCLSEMKSWLGNNFLKLNPTKTEILLVGSRSNLAVLPRLTVTIDDCNLVSHDSVKNLGVVFDSAMSMNLFVSEKCKVISNYLRAIARIRKTLTFEATRLLIHAFVISRLDYCNGLLSASPNYLVQRLQLLQNRAARILCGLAYRDHITPTLKQLHWLPVCQRIKYKLLLLTYQAINGDAPAYLTELIKPYCPARQLRSASHNLLIVPMNSGESFASIGPKLWNQLPQYLKTATSPNAFKKDLKTFLFRAFYY